jgi:hypothetical protein
MALFYPVQQTLLSANLCGPERDCTFLRPACKKFFFVWVPCHHLHRVVFAWIDIDFIGRFSKVVDFYVTILTSGQKPVAVDGVPAHAANHVVRCSDLIPPFSSGSWVPYLYGLIFAACDHKRQERVPLTGLHVVFVLRKRKLFLGSREVEHSRSVVL